MPVKMILQIKDTGESGARGQILVPAAFAALGFDQVLDALVKAAAGGIATGDQPEHRPSCLRRRAVVRRVGVVVVAGAAFAPATIGVLDGAQPFSGAQDV